MKNIRNLLTFAASMMIVAVVLPPADTPATIHAQGIVNQFVEGTWRVTVIPNDGSPRFQALATFNAGGTMVESSELDKGGQGVWQRTGARTFGFTFEQFQFDSAGKLIGILRVRERDEFDPRFDSYSGVGTIEGLDPDRNVVFKACARTQAIRLTVDPPDCR